MTQNEISRETPCSTTSGWLVLPIFPIWIGILAATLIRLQPVEEVVAFSIIGSILCLVFILAGFFVVEPNMARVLVLFGKYRGTVRKDGFHWVFPLVSKKKISLRARNMASQTIKVNDLLGNPIEIAAVVVWQVRDSAQAMFDVDAFEGYVDVQIETAVRQMAKLHPYDDSSDEIDSSVETLRGDSELVSQELQVELQQRLDRAGIEVLEARITHLAYAPEIASAMLQRQQATAVIAARRLIVDGAVGMVEQALDDLGKREIVELDAERRATMVGNLLVVLCGQTAPTPVLNTGSLYN